MTDFYMRFAAGRARRLEGRRVAVAPAVVACLIGLSLPGLAQDSGASSGGSSGGASSSPSSGAPASATPPAPSGPTAPTAEKEAPLPPFGLAETFAPVAAPSDIVRSLNTPSGLTSVFEPRAGGLGFHYSITEALRYDDNARSRLDTAPTPFGSTRGDWYSVTNIGASYAKKVGLQVFRLDGQFGLTRYADNTDLNNKRYSVSAGWDWRLGYPCAGTFQASVSQSEVELQNLLLGAATGLQKTERLDFRGRCHIYDRLFGTFGASAQKLTMSSSQGNDSRQYTMRAGLEYSVPRLHTVGLEVIYLKNDFFNRVSTFFNPQTTQLNQTDYRAYYTYVVSPKTTVNLSAGLTQFETISGSANSNRTVANYAIGVTWRATPKILLNLGTQTVAGPPQGILSDYQRSQLYTATLSYAYSKKLTFSAVYAHAKSQSSVSSPIFGTGVVQNTSTDTVSLDANYRWTPFLTAGLGYRWAQRTDKVSTLKSTSNLYTVTLSYRR